MKKKSKTVKLAPARKSARLKLERALSGTWAFPEQPSVEFRFSRHGSGLRLELHAPPSMSEQAWRALFRFLLFNFDHLRTKVPKWLSPEVQRALKQVRRRRWRRRHVRIRKTFHPKIVKKSPPATPADDDDTTGPSDGLIAVAKQALKKGAKP